MTTRETYMGSPCKKYGHSGLRYKTNHNCVECEKEYSTNYRRNNYRQSALVQARHRASKSGVPFNLELDDIPEVPRLCPVLGIAMAPGKGVGGHTPASPSLDRIKPELGYVKGNVHWISWRANTIKNNASVSELRKVADYFEQLESDYGTAS